MSESLSVALLGACALAMSACSWGRFDDLTSDAPVVVLERPGEIRSGFGTSLSSVTDGDGRALLLVHGTSGYAQAALYELGAGDSPLTDALSDGVCSNDAGTCYLGSSSAPLRRAIGPSGKEFSNCFAVGVGNSSIDVEPGVVVECESRDGFKLGVPEAFAGVLRASLDSKEPKIVALASDESLNPALAVGSGEDRSAFFYPALDADPVSLLPSEVAAEGFGGTVALALVGKRRLIAVGTPARAELHLFVADEGEEPVHLGCIQGADGFSRSLAVGEIASDGTPELVVADAAEVHVLDSGALLELAPRKGCAALSDLPPAALYASVGCSETGAVTGCAASEFGAALAVGDVDGDGDGELVVGAPGMKVRDHSSAGALAFFDLDVPGEGRAAEVKFVASAKKGDRLGSSLAAARVASRHVVAAGIPGSGRTAIFYCPSLLPESLGGARCD